MVLTTRRLGTRIKGLREAAGMSQATLATKAKLAREHVNRLEAGLHAPNLLVLQRLAKALGVPLTELLG